ncbi:MbtH family protein [Inquilinus limosus]|uniref:MbtH family protein n=1 Tax=Inquilinus limosus TaxID=171674 RepID=UPI003F16E3FC
MTNPFEIEDENYIVLKNEENQHSIWPSFLEIPLGWERIYGPARKPDCLSYVDKNWTDLKSTSGDTTK